LSVPATIIDGKTLAAGVRARAATQAEAFRVRHGRPPGLAVVLVGDDPASQVYVRNKRRVCAEVGIASFPHDLPAGTTEGALLALIAELNRRPEVDGVLVQSPVPAPLSFGKVLAALDPAKDVDGLHPLNLGLLLSGRPAFISCTPAGVMEMIRSTGVALEGKKAVVVGRSNLVGKPLALLLLQAHATVTVCHSRTADLAVECRQADVLAVAAGKPNCVLGEWIKPGAVVVDIGTNRVGGVLVGDVEFEKARERAGFISPVPGGVGPMTIAQLMVNTVWAARKHMEDRA
jgi:methylenetetrahydrofolate dehydrogenase (NADP+)/methenyltetrahydrofolate cyclohydrolase